MTFLPIWIEHVKSQHPFFIQFLSFHPFLVILSGLLFLGLIYKLSGLFKENNISKIKLRIYVSLTIVFPFLIALLTATPMLLNYSVEQAKHDFAIVEQKTGKKLDEQQYEHIITTIFNYQESIPLVDIVQ